MAARRPLAAPVRRMTPLGYGLGSTALARADATPGRMGLAERRMTEGISR